MKLDKIKMIINAPNGKDHIIIYDKSKSDNELLVAIYGKLTEDENGNKTLRMKGEVKHEYPKLNEVIELVYK